MLVTGDNFSNGSAVSVAQQPSGRDIDWRICWSVAVAFAILAPWAMDLRAGCSFVSSDGQFWSELFRYHTAQTGYLSFSSADPYQGMFDAFSASYRGWILLELLSGRWLGGTYSVPLLLTSMSLLLGGACFAAARAIELPRSTALVAALFVTMMLIPFLHCHNIQGIYSLSPQVAYLCALPLLIVALYRPIISLRSPATWLRAVALAVVAILPLLEQAMVTVITIPVTAFAGLATLASSRSRQELGAKVFVAIFIALLFIALGILPYLSSLGGYVDFPFFFIDLNDFQATNEPTLRDAWHDFMTIVLRVDPHVQRVQWVTFASVIGTSGWVSSVAIATCHGRRTTRIFAATFAIFPIVLFAVYFVLHYLIAFIGVTYPAPQPYHFTYIAYPFLIIFLIEVVLRMASFVARPVVRFARPAGFLSAQSSVSLATVLILLVVGTVVLPLRYARFRAGGDVATVMKEHLYGDAFQPGRGLLEYRTNAIADVLRDQLSFGEGRRFNGFVATFASYRQWFTRCGEYDPSDWMNLTGDLPGRVINIGMLHHNIPTLYQTAATRTPQFYFASSALLVGSDDRTTRTWLVLSKPDARVLQLWGARYVVSDRPLPFGTLVVAPASPNPDLSIKCGDAQFARYYLYRLDGANVGDYSPTVTELAQDAADIVRKIHQAEFDGRKAVVTDRPIGNGFIAVRSASMAYENGGLRIEASTDGESLLVLPAQYSNCWSVVGNDASKVELFRANLIQLGLRLRGSVSVRLELRHGPFWHHTCRYADAADMRRLQVGQGALDNLRRDFRQDYVPGDGRNLIAASEELDKVIGSSSHAELVALNQQCGTLREYRLSTRGAVGEHYIGPYTVSVEPGFYTLSVQVRTEGTPWLRLQLLDGANNGAKADYDLSSEVVRPIEMRADRRTYGTIDRREGWFKLSLTSMLNDTEARVIIQLLSKTGSGYFSPQDQVVRFRAVQLERGASASGYQQSEGHADAVGQVAQSRCHGE